MTQFILQTPITPAQEAAAAQAQAKQIGAAIAKIAPVEEDHIGAVVGRVFQVLVNGTIGAREKKLIAAIEKGLATYDK